MAESSSGCTDNEKDGPHRHTRPATSTTTINQTSNTYNFINCGQVINVNGGNTVIQAGCCNPRPPPYPPPQHMYTTRTDARSTASSDPYPQPHRSSHVMTEKKTYAAGCPDSMELLALTKKLAGVLGPRWKLLAAPLEIPDYELQATDVDEYDLLTKINRLLNTWVGYSGGHNRAKLASLLASVDLGNCAEECLN